MTKIHPSIVRFTFANDDSLAYYIDTHAMDRKKPHKYYDALATNVDPDRAGNVKDVMAISDRRWANNRKKPKRFKYAKLTDLIHANDETLHHVMDSNKSKAINEIEAAWLDKTEPSWAAVEHLKNRNWEAAELVFSHA